MKVTQMPPVHAANLAANSGNTAYGVDVIKAACAIRSQSQPRCWQKTNLTHWPLGDAAPMCSRGSQWYYVSYAGLVPVIEILYLCEVGAHAL